MSNRRPPAGVPTKGRTPTTAELQSAVDDRDLDRLIALLDEGGRLPALRSASKIISRTLADEPDTMFRWGVDMGGRGEWSARMMASWLTSPFWAEHRASVEAQLLELGDDENWGIREGAAFGFGRVLDDNFERVVPTYAEWAAHPSENIRRAVALSVMPVVRNKRRGAERAPACLDLIEPLMSDRSPYVRKNLGPFAIGSAILPHHPDLTFARLDQWIDEYVEGSDAEYVRWNIAMSVSSSGGARHPTRSLELLARLADDDRRFVSGAVRSATRSLAKKHPALVAVRDDG